MKITAHIDEDVKSTRKYFDKLFVLLDEAITEEKTFPLEVVDRDADEYQGCHFSISHQIKPDMLLNIYNLIDFWLKEISRLYKLQKGLKLGSKDISGDNDLHAYHKYLIQYLEQDLSAVNTNYQRLQKLREIRNAFIHNGGHVEDQKKRNKIASTPGVRFEANTLIVVDDSFVWKCLDDAEMYLRAAASNLS